LGKIFKALQKHEVDRKKKALETERPAPKAETGTRSLDSSDVRTAPLVESQEDLSSQKEGSGHEDTSQMGSRIDEDQVEKIPNGKKRIQESIDVEKNFSAVDPSDDTADPSVQPTNKNQSERGTRSQDVPITDENLLAIADSDGSPKPGRKITETSGTMGSIVRTDQIALSTEFAAEEDPSIRNSDPVAEVENPEPFISNVPLPADEGNTQVRSDKVKEEANEPENSLDQQAPPAEISEVDTIPQQSDAQIANIKTTETLETDELVLEIDKDWKPPALEQTAVDTVDPAKVSLSEEASHETTHKKTQQTIEAGTPDITEQDNPPSAEKPSPKKSEIVADIELIGVPGVVEPNESGKSEEIKEEMNNGMEPEIDLVSKTPAPDISSSEKPTDKIQEVPKKTRLGRIINIFKKKPKEPDATTSNKTADETDPASKKTKLGRLTNILKKKPREPVSVHENLVVLNKPYSFEAEQFKILRTNLLFPATGEPPRSILITSSVPNEGKSFVSANLAASIAQNVNEYVLLIDCDIRKPCMHSWFELGEVAGLSEYLSGDIPLDTILRKSKLDKLTILPGGKPPHNPAELLSSKKMKELLEEVQDRYKDRYIIIDSPPPRLTAETAVIARHVEGVVLVVRFGKTPRDDVLELIENVGKHKVVGTIINRLDTKLHGYDKYTRYGKYSSYYRGASNKSV